VLVVEVIRSRACQGQDQLRESGRRGTALGGVPPFPKILDPTERSSISPGVPPIWYILVSTRETVRKNREALFYKRRRELSH